MDRIFFFGRRCHSSTTFQIKIFVWGKKSIIHNTMIKVRRIFQKFWAKFAVYDLKNSTAFCVVELFAHMLKGAFSQTIWNKNLRKILLPTFLNFRSVLEKLVFVKSWFLFFSPSGSLDIFGQRVLCCFFFFWFEIPTR